MGGVKGHYVPKFYLRGFTKTDDNNGTLHVLDKKQLRQWRSTPSGSASERDMYAVNPEVANGDGQAVENLFATLEAKFGTTLRSTLAEGKLPTGEPWDVLLNFMALSAVRGPLFRASFHDFTGRVLKSVSHAMVSTPGGWKWLKDTVAAAGGFTEGLSHETMKVFVHDNSTSFQFDQTTYVQFLIEAVGSVLPLLAARNWTLWTAADDAPDFVCSDMPMAVTAGTPSPFTHALAFGAPDTMLTFPLNRHTVLAGVYEGHLRPATLDARRVAAINNATAQQANQIYSSEAEFAWWRDDSGNGTATDLLAFLKAQRGRRPKVSRDNPGDSGDGKRYV
jgi:hypothetical protein